MSYASKQDTYPFLDSAHIIAEKATDITASNRRAEMIFFCFHGYYLLFWMHNRFERINERTFSNIYEFIIPQFKDKCKGSFAGLEKIEQSVLFSVC